MVQGFLLKYAEIGIKGKNRYKFENALCEQVKIKLSKIDGDYTVVREQGRIYAEASGSFDFDEVVEELQKGCRYNSNKPCRSYRGQIMGQPKKSSRGFYREAV